MRTDETDAAAWTGYPIWPRKDPVDAWEKIVDVHWGWVIGAIVCLIFALFGFVISVLWVFVG